MKILIRAFVLSLVATGAVASMHTSNPAVTATLSTRSSAMPVPSCPPDTPDGCGVGTLGK